MLLLLHSLTRKRRTMPRQARKLSGTKIRHVILCRHSPAGKTDRCLFRSNTIIVANEMITSPHDSTKAVSDRMVRAIGRLGTGTLHPRFSTLEVRKAGGVRAETCLCSSVRATVAGSPSPCRGLASRGALSL